MNPDMMWEVIKFVAPLALFCGFWFRAGQWKGEIDLKIVELEKSLNEKTEANTASLGDKAKALRDNFGEETETITNNLNEKIEASTSSLNEKIEASTSSLNAKIEAMTNNVNEKIEASTGNLNVKTEAITNNFNEKIAGVGEKLQENKEALGKFRDEVRADFITARAETRSINEKFEKINFDVAFLTGYRTAQERAAAENKTAADIKATETQQPAQK